MKYYTKFDGGIPVSFINSTQQWYISNYILSDSSIYTFILIYFRDFPNVWAPNQQSIIMMLLKYDKDLSLKIARNFFNSVYEGWKKHNVFYEKYDATKPGERGSGGEYTVQSGFGWTNGVTLQLLKIFKDTLIN